MGRGRCMKIWIYLLLLVSFNASCFEREKYYSDKMCLEDYKGNPTRTQQGLYVDCETVTAAMEFDWAKRPKNYECIGQAVVYAEQTGKLAVCVLLARSDKEYTFALDQLKYMNRAGVYLIIRKVS